MSTLTADSLSHNISNHSSSGAGSGLQNRSVQHHQEVKPLISLSYRDIMTAMTMRTSPTSTAPSAASEQFDQNTLINYVYYFIKNFIGASGTNTVAIDNKIEQAMDLVKSHLMFAVREEVEVLKEKISELMERITQLEHENTILRAGATQETLALLATSKPPANSNCTNSNS